MVDGIEVDVTLNDPPEHPWVELALLHLDATPEGVDIVIGKDRDRVGLGDDVGRVVEHLGGDVDGRAGLRVPRLQRVANSELARVEREQRRVDVEDATGEVVEEDRVEDREEPCHRHHINAALLEQDGNSSREVLAIPVVADVLAVAVDAAVDDRGGDAGFTCDLDASAGLVGEDEVDGDTGLDHGIQDGAAAGNQHGDLGLGHVSTPSADCVGWCELCTPNEYMSTFINMKA